MKLFSIALLLGVFIVLPVYTLNAMVLPAINGLHQQYSQASALADRISNQ